MQKISKKNTNFTIIDSTAILECNSFKTLKKYSYLAIELETYKTCNKVICRHYSVKEKVDDIEKIYCLECYYYVKLLGVNDLDTKDRQ